MAKGLAPFLNTVRVKWPAHLQSTAKAHLLRVARDGHAKIMADAVKRSGTAPDFEAYANKPGNTNLASVRLPGPIVYLYRYRAEMIVEALRALREASPVVSGRYRNSHTLYVNGVAVVGIPRSLAPTDEVFISNPVPYARRLEIGRTTSGRSFVLQVQPRIYERVAKNILIPKYRSAAKISFGYVSLPGAYRIKGALPSHYRTDIAPEGRVRKRRQKVGEAIRAPAIIFEVLK